MSQENITIDINDVNIQKYDNTSSDGISSSDEFLKFSKQQREKDYGNGWTESTVGKFEELLKICRHKTKLHYKASIYYAKWYRYITYPSIFLSTLITILTTYNTSGYNPDIAYWIAAISGINSLVTGFSSFWEYSKRSSLHTSTSLQYSDIKRQITTELFLPIGQRNSIKYDFDVYSLLLHNIESTELHIPEHILLKKK